MATPTHKANNLERQNNFLSSAKEQTSSDVERDATRVTCLPPAILDLNSDSPVVSVSFENRDESDLIDF